MIKKILPDNVKGYITEKTEEIRIRLKRPIVILDRDREIFSLFR